MYKVSERSKPKRQNVLLFYRSTHWFTEWEDKCCKKKKKMAVRCIVIITKAPCNTVLWARIQLFLSDCASFGPSAPCCCLRRRSETVCLTEVKEKHLMCDSGGNALINSAKNKGVPRANTNTHVLEWDFLWVTPAGSGQTTWSMMTRT